MPTAAAAPHGFIGRAIAGKYRIIRALGEGGMGAVYEAEHTGLGTRVAVKVLRPEYTVRADVVRRFQQEARAAATIGHPNIVSILDIDRDPHDNSLYMVLELLRGVDLDGYLRHAGGRLDPQLALQIALPVLSALAAAHDRGVLHRDLKPANIFLVSNTNGAITPKVIDFGIAKMQSDAGDTKHTREGAIMGTLAYMSPEQLAGDPTIDARADIWAMGVVLYEMLAGTCPFAPPSGSDMNLAVIAGFAMRVTTEPAPRIETHVPDLPPDLAAIVHQALATDRAARFQSMRELRAALADSSIAKRGAASGQWSLDDSTIPGFEPAERAFIQKTAMEDATRPLPVSRPEEAPATAPKSRRSLLAALIVLLTCAAGVAGFALFWRTPEGAVDSTKRDMTQPVKSATLVEEHRDMLMVSPPDLAMPTPPRRPPTKRSQSHKPLDRKTTNGLPVIDEN